MFNNNYVIIDEKTRTDNLGNRYENLNLKEIDKFCELFEGDKNVQALGAIYESKVPRIFYDTEAIVKSMRAKYNVD